MSVTVIEAENLTKSFDWTPVLKGISCRVHAGEVIGVFGPNGAGKTTFLRILATLLKPSAGRLSLFGLAPQHPDARRRLGFLGHESFLYPDLTPVENLTFYGRVYQITEIGKRVKTALEHVELQDWQDTPVRAFSRGMEQRLALARVLLHDPDLLLLDEPYTGLDTRATTMLQTIVNNAKADGKTIVMTTHDFDRGLGLCDRAFIFSGGHLVWQSAESLPPASEFISLYERYTQPARLRTLNAGR